MTVLGILGGSGVYEIAGLKNAEWRRAASPFGETSDEFLFGVLDGLDVVFVPRHGRGHRHSPSSINYRANIDATGWKFYWEHIRQAIMPVMVLGLFQGASLVRFVRSSVLDVIKLDYVTTARSKGIGERKVITKHVVRNALIPVVTLVALQMPIVFGGAIVTEQIFRIPGIGSLLISAMLANDTPVVMAVTFVFACLVVLFNLIADILYGWLDPRIAFR